MAIEGLKNYFSVKKSEKKQEKTNQIPEVRYEGEKSGANKKISNSTLSAALLAALMLPAATSCVDQDQSVNIPGMENFMNESLEYQKQVIDLLTQILALIQNGNDQNKEYFEQLVELNTQISTILMGIGSDVEDISNALVDISSIMRNMYENDQELLAKIDAIIDGQGTDQEKLEQLIALNKEQNEWLAKIYETQNAIKNISEESAENIEALLNQYLEGQLTHTELMNQMLAEIKKNGNISADILAQIEGIMNGEGADSAKLDKIIGLLESIDSKLGSLLVEVQNIGDNFVTEDGEKLADILKELVEKFEDHSITSNALAAEILNELKQSNINDEAIQNKIDVIIEQLNNQQITDKEALEQITNLLAQMNEKLSTALTTLSNISAKLDDLYNQNEENRNNTYEMLTNINNGIGSIDSKMEEIINNQKTGNNISLEILDKLDEAVAQLNQINTKTITIEQLKDMFGPMYDEIINKLGNIEGNQVNIDDVIAIAESMKPDLTKTNALLETINTTIQNKNFTGEFSAQLDELSDIMTEVLGEIKNGNKTEAEGLAEILSKLASMEGSLEAIQAAAEQINKNFQSFMKEAQTYGEKWTDQFQQLIDGQEVNKSLFQSYTDLFTQKAEQAEQAQQERIAAVIAAIENISGSNGSVDIDELISKLPDYTDLLTEIRDAIGNLVTKEDLEDYGNTHRTDLTKTNALLETINTTIQNKNFTVTGSAGTGSTDMTEVIEAINRIREQLQNAQLPTKEQMNTLLKYVNEIAANSGSEVGTKALAKANVKSQREHLYAMLNEYNRIAAQEAGRQSVYMAPEFDYTGRSYTV